jgi:predicted NAD/FAD-dependent oxidoreductase
MTKVPTRDVRGVTSVTSIALQLLFAIQIHAFVPHTCSMPVMRNRTGNQLISSSYSAPSAPSSICGQRNMAIFSSSSTKEDANDSTQQPALQNNGKKTVAIIGGGIAGLSCAAHLSKSNTFEPIVFDTGRIRFGGRCSSRIPGDKAKNKNGNQDRILNRFIIDHAAQILTVQDDHHEEYGAFVAQVRQWEKNGIVKEFPSGSVVEILTSESSNNDQEDDNPSKPLIRSLNDDNDNDNDNVQSTKGGSNQKLAKMYYGVNGMGSIASAIAYPPNSNDNYSDNDDQPMFKVHQDVWISPSNGVKFIGSQNMPKWTVQTNGKRFGTYDAVVIAHNGKCADRLMSRTPAKALHSLLRTNFNANVPAWGGKKMTLNSIYSLTIALKKETSPFAQVLKDDVISAFIKNEPKLRFLTCQTRKYIPEKDKDDIEVWTILSSATFAKKHKGPQENLPNETIEEVTNLMLESLGESLGLKKGLLHEGVILDSRLQLWGAAVPLNCYRWNNEDNEEKSRDLNDGFVFDSEYAVGACGDWLLDPSILGAWESGRRLSEWFQKHENESVGLPPQGAFRVSKAAAGSGIGNVR